MNRADELKRLLARLEKDPRNAELFAQIGKLLVAFQDLENAEKYFRKAYEYSPENTGYIQGYADVLSAEYKYRQCLPLYLSLAALSPGNRETAEKLGDCYYQLGEYEAAAQWYESLQNK